MPRAAPKTAEFCAHCSTGDEVALDNDLPFVDDPSNSDDRCDRSAWLNRTSGVGGLAAIRAKNGRILRPLLDWRRSDLVEVALDNDLPFVDDPSNSDDRFDRARLRHALRSQTAIDPVASAKSAAWLAEADEALDWAVERLIASWPDASDIAVIRDESYPPEIFRRIVAQRLRANAPQLALRGASLDGVITAMHQGRRAMVGALLIDAVRGLEGTIWRISAAPRRKVPKKG